MSRDWRQETASYESLCVRPRTNSSKDWRNKEEDQASFKESDKEQESDSKAGAARTVVNSMFDMVREKKVEEDVDAQRRRERTGELRVKAQAEARVGEPAVDDRRRRRTKNGGEALRLNHQLRGVG